MCNDSPLLVLGQPTQQGSQKTHPSPHLQHGYAKGYPLPMNYGRDRLSGGQISAF